MAPDYLDCVPKLLESRQVSADSITSHLSGLKKVTQYDRTFKTFWAFLTEQGSQLPAFPLDEVALQLKKMHFVNQQVAKNAYSAIVAVPGYDSLKFYPLLKECKRQWYSSAKYATFCDCKPVLEKLKDTPVKWTVIRHVRDRLILVLRLIHLFRAVDLAQTWRTMSTVGDAFFLKVKRKGAARPSWELIVAVPDCRTICPKTLLLQYVALTAAQCRPGTLLFRALQPPFHPLKPNTLGSLTKTLLQSLGFPLVGYGPHSTRGAGVKMYKELGFTSEQVCEIGKWKNPTAFTAHYLRIGATRNVAEVLPKMFSKGKSAQNSPLRSAESDWACTPGNVSDTGGRVQEDEAQNNGEPTHPPRFSFKKPSKSKDTARKGQPSRTTPSTASPKQ
jgi:hypothetical protein